jgi:alkyldihydroxyacetonephosphate synthase
MQMLLNRGSDRDIFVAICLAAGLNGFWFLASIGGYVGFSMLACRLQSKVLGDARRIPAAGSSRSKRRPTPPSRAFFVFGAPPAGSRLVTLLTSMQFPFDHVPHSFALLDRHAASRDLWPGGTLDYWQGRAAPAPEMVVWPETETQVSDVLSWASNQEIPVVTYGAGSGVCGGARGRAGAITLDMKRFSAIGPLDPVRRTVEVEAGVLGQHLEDWLEARGFSLGHSPSSIGCSTVGGWAAARSAGQFSSRYGVFEDMVLQMRVVTPGRGAFTVGEGGDAPAEWMDQLLGSEGTLGVITRVRLRIWPQPEARWLRGYRFPDVASAVDAMRTLMQGELWPSVVRLYDPVDTWIGGRGKSKRTSGDEAGASWVRGLLKHLEDVPGVRERSLAIPLAVPRLLNRIFDASASGCLLIVGFEGDSAVVDASVAAARPILETDGKDLGAEPGERWFHARHTVSYKLMPIFERGGFADTMEVACRWSDLEGLYEAVRRAVSPTVVVMAHMSHVYPEGGSIYFSFAGRGDRATYDATWSAALEAVVNAGATVSHHHGIGALKAGAASREVGPAVAGWRALRAALDPVGVLNPERLFTEPVPSEVAPLPDLTPADGLERLPWEATPAPGEASWPWAKGRAPVRWQRLPWQVGWVEVSGLVDGVRCTLGRAPRSAVGPDLRAWLSTHGAQVTVTRPVAPPGPRVLGCGQPADPWRVAHELLRSDLRPAQLYVEEGCLFVGFRGPAAEALFRIAAERVPGGLVPVPWTPRLLPDGSWVPCPFDDPGVAMVTLEGAFRKEVSA